MALYPLYVYVVFYEVYVIYEKYVNPIQSL